jgi:hypothetical protein
MPQSPALRFRFYRFVVSRTAGSESRSGSGIQKAGDRAFRGFESEKTPPEIERTVMLQPASQHFGPSSELHLQGIVPPGRNVNPRVKHLPACHDFGTRDVVISKGRNRPAGVWGGLFLWVSFHPQCAVCSGGSSSLDGGEMMDCAEGGLSRGVTISNNFLSAAFALLDPAPRGFPKESGAMFSPTSKGMRLERFHVNRSIGERDRFQNSGKLISNGSGKLKFSE